MRTFLVIAIIGYSFTAQGQSLVGTWQLTEEKPCISQQIEESDTEKDLLKSFGSSGSAVARIIRFDPKGKGQEGIFGRGKRKGSDMEAFRYQLSGNELQFLDKKSGIIMERFAIDELSSTTLKFHRVGRECEVRTLIRVK